MSSSSLDASVGLLNNRSADRMADMSFISPPDTVQRFIETEDATLLEKPLVFGKTTKFNNFMYVAAPIRLHMQLCGVERS